MVRPDFDSLARILDENRNKPISDRDIDRLAKKFRDNDLKYYELMKSQKVSHEQMNKRFDL